MKIEDIENRILSRYDGIKIKDAYAERSLFYNPEHRLPNGIYFVTIKNRDGKNDSSSNLNRDDVFRVSFQLSSQNYKNMFGEKPSRPAKGDTVNLDIDFKNLGILMLHPVYAWMNFVCINNPDLQYWESVIIPLLDHSYEIVQHKFIKKVR